MVNLRSSMNKLLILSLFALSACGFNSVGERSCTVSPKVDGVVTISCPDGTKTTITDGSSGSDGEKGDRGEVGAPGTQVSVIPLCPEITGSHPEVLLRIDGLLYAFMEDGNQGRLVWVKPGNYVTTDRRNCAFTVDSNNQVTY